MGNSVVVNREEVQKRIHEKLFPEGEKPLELSGLDSAVLSQAATTVRNQLADGTLSMPIEHVVQVFFSQLQKIGNRNFALADVFYKRAIQRGAQFSASIKDFTSPADYNKLPLLGFVMSLKDNIKYQGSDSTLGFTKNIGKPVAETPRFIKFLEYQGAIFLCKGNVPQSLLPFETDNVCFGTTSNPYDETRTSGGSSGGDCALVATNCVNAAIGTDIAGSLRIPALFCGVCTLKPTVGRLPLDCEAGPFDQLDLYGKTGDRQTLINSTLGPITKNVDDLMALCRVMMDYSVFDPRIPPLPWKNVALPKKVGLVRGFEDILETNQVIERAMTTASECLKAKGLEVVTIDIGNLVQQIAVHTFAIFFKDQGFLDIAEDKVGFAEPLIPAFDNIRQLLRYPVSELKVHVKTMTARQAIVMQGYILSKEVNIGYLQDQQAGFTESLIEAFKNAGVEVAVAPGLCPALKKFTSKFCNVLTAVVAIWNFANFPAGALPVVRVKQEEEAYTSVLDDPVASVMKETMKGSSGLPVGVQVVGLPWRDELVLLLMKTLESGLAFK